MGDDVQSWAYDGQRVLKWHSGEEDYGEQWAVGDIIGSMVDFDARTISFSRNGGRYHQCLALPFLARHLA
eukprot:SAG22_NODE_468_length_10147_cov_77.238654_3_plen_70_part_00